LDISIAFWQYGQEIKQRSFVYLVSDALRSRFVPVVKIFARVAGKRKLDGNQWPQGWLRTRLQERFGKKKTRMQISIIVPVLNEALLIRPFLRHLRERAPGAEIVVVDGGSSDGSGRLAAGLCDQLVETERSRAVQMNSGARTAHRDLLWFVHVDTEVPWGCLDEIARIMHDPKIVGGYFRIRLPRGLVYRLTDTFAHYAGILFRMRCSDHGIFCRRSDFLEIGGFPEVPLMEDIEFFRKLHRCGRVRYTRQRLLVSARRYETIGRTRLTLVHGLIVILYILGVPLSKLASIYKRVCRDGSEVIGSGS
jgi:rSAM/selenodomain-associated transferase 2